MLVVSEGSMLVHIDCTVYTDPQLTPDSFAPPPKTQG